MKTVTLARLGDEPLPSITLPEHEILEGTPDARCRFTTGSSDRGACAGFWSCDVGRYRFVFDYDEFVYLIAGRVVITQEGTGTTFVLDAGSTAHFPQGTTSTWDVTQPMVKYFVARVPFEEP